MLDCNYEDHGRSDCYRIGQSFPSRLQIRNSVIAPSRVSEISYGSRRAQRDNSIILIQFVD
jgi:hypothetical protein